jgi:hypothetical protein
MNLKSPRTALFAFEAFAFRRNTNYRICLHHFDSGSQTSMPLKRKAGSQALADAKKAKTAIEYAAATQPRIQERTDLTLLLDSTHEHHKKPPPTKGNVVHWFRSDLRLEDNRALHAASRKAIENGTSLIALYVVSPQVIPREDFT